MFGIESYRGLSGRRILLGARYPARWAGLRDAAPLALNHRPEGAVVPQPRANGLGIQAGKISGLKGRDKPSNVRAKKCSSVGPESQARRAVIPQPRPTAWVFRPGKS